MKYRREIDGLRALAVVPVILFHAGAEAFSGGFVGVDVFFVISGYLIAATILPEIEAGHFSLSAFYERRARRILPALLLMTCVCVPFAWYWMTPKYMESFAEAVLAILAFASNILFWRKSGYFDASAELNPLLHTWSLAVEEQYYLLFPVLLLFAWRLRKNGAMTLLLLGSGLSLAAAQWGSAEKPIAAFYLLPSRAWELMLGAIVALHRFRRIAGNTHWLQSEALGLLGLLLIIGSVFRLNSQTPYPSLYTLAPTFGTVLVILHATEGTIASRFLGSRVLVGVGLVSYSAYLWHQPLFAFARLRSTGAPNGWLLALLAIASLFVGYLSWKFVERPFRDRSRVGSRQFALAVALGAGMLGVLGTMGYARKGDLWRYSSEDVETLREVPKWQDYTWERKNRIELKPFDPDSSLKVFVIGDSNAGDLINAITETGLRDGLSLSGFTIYAGCGNLYLNMDRFRNLLKAKDLPACEKGQKAFGAEKTRDLLREASIVLLASAWTPWESKLIAESLEALTSEYGDKFYVFGTKQVDFELSDYMSVSLGSRGSLLRKASSKGVEVNDTLTAKVGKRFIDPYAFLCDNTLCRVTDQKGRLHTYDGFHLTELGANYMGQRLREHPVFAMFVKANE